MLQCSMIWVHTPTPIAFSLGPLDIRWYSLAYLTTLLALTFYTQHYVKSTGIHLKKKLFFDPFFTHVCIGVIAGGRLGQVLFYDMPYYMEHPLEIFAIWEGGMSFHGGALGVLIQSWYTARRTPPLTWGMLTSCAAFVAPLGLFLGRCANYLNGELVGTPTNADWGVIFAMYDTIPRHPVQLYEAICEGPILWTILYLSRRHIRQRCHWDTTIIFILGYCTLRFFIEFTKELRYPCGALSLAQIYCLTFITIALPLYIYVLTKRSS